MTKEKASKNNGMKAAVNITSCLMQMIKRSSERKWQKLDWKKLDFNLILREQR